MIIIKENRSLSCKLYKSYFLNKIEIEKYELLLHIEVKTKSFSTKKVLFSTNRLNKHHTS